MRVLAEHAESLGEPYTRHLGDGVRELHSSVDGAAIRITYWLAPRRRIILLTVFRKTRMREDAEVKSAILAQQLCAEPNTHPPTRHSFAQSREENWTDEARTLEDPPGARTCRGLHRSR
ncbi:type II toxin-antitoxin system RelE/ParE family toxin [Nocardia exalbida]|uniref:type II toxin-antitoxin system RelE/ParE family toxin n=1 Tax=Nocardia exalbida TaxID=290231 RepID=UPI001C3F2F1C